MSIRDKNDIAAKIVYEAMRWAVANQQGLRDGKTPSWVDHGNGFAQGEARSAADAILAALPDMIKPLVWDDEQKEFENDLYRVFDFTNGFYLEYNGSGVASKLSFLELMAAANAHHRAAIMAAFDLT
jgi:hypothetical protein